MALAAFEGPQKDRQRTAEGASNRKDGLEERHKSARSSPKQKSASKKEKKKHKTTKEHVKKVGKEKVDGVDQGEDSTSALEATGAVHRVVSETNLPEVTTHLNQLLMQLLPNPLLEVSCACVKVKSIAESKFHKSL